MVLVRVSHGRLSVSTHGGHHDESCHRLSAASRPTPLSPPDGTPTAPSSAPKRTSAGTAASSCHAPSRNRSPAPVSSNADRHRQGRGGHPASIPRTHTFASVRRGLEPQCFRPRTSADVRRDPAEKSSGRRGREFKSPPPDYGRCAKAQVRPGPSPGWHKVPFVVTTWSRRGIRGAMDHWELE